METVDSILRKAVRLGACCGSSKATDWKSLCWLFFTPQGREFCGRNNYPSIDMFRNMKSYVRPYNVYVDEDGKAHASIRITEDGKIEAYFLLLETPFNEKDFNTERKLKSFSEIVKLSKDWGTEI